jgi:DnaK suppressor protein
MRAHIRPLPSRAEALRAMLEVTRATLQQERTDLSRQVRAAGPGEGQDEADRANQDLQHEFASAQVRHLTVRLRDIDAALARHAEGEYGQCVGCGGDIPLRRLRSLPSARYCRACQEARETSDLGRLAA